MITSFTKDREQDFKSPTSTKDRGIGQHPNHFTEDIENLLECIRQNSIMLSHEHQKSYNYLRNMLKIYRIPIIVLCSLNSIIALCDEYFPQKTITICNIVFSFSCSIIGALELFMQVTDRMVAEKNLSKDFQILASDIYTCMSLHPQNRIYDGKTFMEEKYKTYVKLIESSEISIRSNFKDKLCVLPEKKPYTFIERISQFLDLEHGSSNNPHEHEPESEKDSIYKKHVHSLERISQFLDLEHGSSNNIHEPDSEKDLICKKHVHSQKRPSLQDSSVMKFSSLDDIMIMNNSSKDDLDISGNSYTEINEPTESLHNYSPFKNTIARFRKATITQLEEPIQEKTTSETNENTKVPISIVTEQEDVTFSL